MGAEVAEVAAECSVENENQEYESSKEVVGSADLTIPANTSQISVDSICNTTEEIYKLGFSLSDLYKLSLEFYRKAKDELPLSYFDKVQLVALWKQVTAGRYSQSKSPEIGYFDVIGNDRKKAWEALGDVAPDVAKQRFCELLEGNCPAYVNFVAEKKAEIDAEIERRRLEEEERIRLETEEREKKKKEEEERIRIEEEERIRLEEEEKAREAASLAAAIVASQAAESVSDNVSIECNAGEAILYAREEDSRLPHDTSEECTDSEFTTPPIADLTIHHANGETPSNTAIAPASLWTRPKLEEFISHVKGDASSVLIVGRGETVTIRVPTHDKGSCLFWEFATDYYDVGFGVYFEWSTVKSPVISVNINESDNDDSSSEHKNEQIDENKDEDNIVVIQKPSTDEVLPVLRRNSHEQVIVGSHMYPGHGIYLLKFDNSYSLLRSKTLYYRVYYTK